MVTHESLCFPLLKEISTWELHIPKHMMSWLFPLSGSCFWGLWPLTSLYLGLCTNVCVYIIACICVCIYMCMHIQAHVCSVMSDSLRPHGLEPDRLFCPWDFHGTHTGVGCHFLLQGSFLTQDLNLCLLYCRQILNRLSHACVWVCTNMYIMHACLHMCICAYMYAFMFSVHVCV